MLTRRGTAAFTSQSSVVLTLLSKVQSKNMEEKRKEQYRKEKEAIHALLADVRYVEEYTFTRSVTPASGGYENSKKR